MVSFDRSRLDQARYKLGNPQDDGEFQKSVEEFVNLARRDELPPDQTLIDDFCALVKGKEGLHHAKRWVPEFRGMKARQ